MKAPPLPLWRMPRARYDRPVEAGVFGPDDRVELLDGLLVAREPQGARHATGVVLGRAVLEKAFGRSYHVREEKPIALDEQSEPEPDIVVVPGRPRDYLDAHPSRPRWSSRSPRRRSPWIDCGRAACTRGRESPTTGLSTCSTRCSRFTASRCAGRRGTPNGSTTRSFCCGATRSSRRSPRQGPASASPLSCPEVRAERNGSNLRPARRPGAGSR